MPFWGAWPSADHGYCATYMSAFLSAVIAQGAIRLAVMTMFAILLRDS